MKELLRSSLEEVSELIARRAISVVELVEVVLAHVANTEPQIHGFAFVDHDGARAAARTADSEIGSGSYRGPLHGIPVGVKDLIDVAGLPTGAGSNALAGNVAATDAGAVARFREGGAILIGKTTTHEFAWGRNIPPTRSPWDTSCYPGGSSAGSGVTVAAGSLFAALGTDTAGSVRNPASVNGLVALKPTYGSISRTGVIPLAPSLDTIGPIARTVTDCALVMSAVAGHDPHDQTSLAEPPRSFRALFGESIWGTRLGIDRQQLEDAEIRPEVTAALEEALDVLRDLGVVIVEVAIPELRHALVTTQVIVMSESAVWHRQLLQSKLADYDPATRVMLELASLSSAADYLNAVAARIHIQNAVKATFQRENLFGLVGPTMPTPTIPVERYTAGHTHERTADDLAGTMHLLAGASLLGSPAISVPCGFSSSGLPIGLHITGRPLADSEVLALAHAYEQATDWHTRVPIDIVAASVR